MEEIKSRGRKREGRHRYYSDDVIANWHFTIGGWLKKKYKNIVCVKHNL